MPSKAVTSMSTFTMLLLLAEVQQTSIVNSISPDALKSDANFEAATLNTDLSRPAGELARKKLQVMAQSDGGENQWVKNPPSQHSDG
ncbi:hypothetical protein [Rhizobium leguminosarum]|uniref:hypothetical protein n=1 Tax=Rhizobium leguminosarum TaxID=384 RepID=UPI001C950A0C|nr:hypothetical protein [Rhizobium leguminosarum]MBY5816067.1 hypothetical protein [Rhizobium leguminosarum]